MAGDHKDMAGKGPQKLTREFNNCGRGLALGL